MKDNYNLKKVKESTLISDSIIASLGNYDRPTNQRTNRQGHIEGTLPIVG